MLAISELRAAQAQTDAELQALLDEADGEAALAGAARQNEALRAVVYNLAAQLRDLAAGDDPSGRNLALGRFHRDIQVVIEARDRARAQARTKWYVVRGAWCVVRVRGTY